MEDMIIKTYPNAEAVEWLDNLYDGWFKDRDEWVHEFYHYQHSLNSTIATELDNFLMRYTHWVIEETKNQVKSNEIDILENYQDLLESQHKFQLKAEGYFNARIKDRDNMTLHHVDFLKNAVKIHWNVDGDYNGYKVIPLDEFLNYDHR